MEICKGTKPRKMISNVSVQTFFNKNVAEKTKIITIPKLVDNHLMAKKCHTYSCV